MLINLVLYDFRSNPIEGRVTMLA